MKLLLLSIVFIVIHSFCRQSSEHTSKTNTSIPNKTESEPNYKELDKDWSKDAANNLKFRKHDIYDHEGTGMVAFSCLVPEGWTTNDKLFWEYNDATLPVRYRGIFENSKNNMLIQAYPDIRMVYSSGPTGVSGVPPPNGIIPGLKAIIKHERARMQYTITDQKLIHKSRPTTSNQYGNQVVSNSETGMVRIEYNDNNQLMEEEFYGQFDIHTTASYGVVALYSTIWSGTSLYSVRALKGKIEACRQIALTLKASTRATLPFYNKLTQVIQLLSDAVYARIYQAGQISKIISQTNDQISKSISDSYWQSQRSYERTNNQFSDAMRGIDQYNDGSQYPVQLPSGYDNAWVNDRGEYLLSQSTDYDPNTTQTGNWHQLARK